MADYLDILGVWIYLRFSVRIYRDRLKDGSYIKILSFYNPKIS